MDKRFISGIAVGIALGALGWIGIEAVIENHGTSFQLYAGQQTRVVSSLSGDDIRQLQNGEGWGLAKPAELNGYPGPAHVLEISEKLELTPDQQRAVQASFDRMKSTAMEIGIALIEAEQALDAAFKDKLATPALIEQRLLEVERARSELRATHLNAHIEVTPILSDTQNALYASLRGYGSGHSNHGGHK